jgi:hypothetical protein
MADYLAPYQIKIRNGKAWLENTEKSTTFFHGNNTPTHRRMLCKQQAKMNSQVGLDRCGV